MFVLRLTSVNVIYWFHWSAVNNTLETLLLPKICQKSILRMRNGVPSKQGTLKQSIKCLKDKKMFFWLFVKILKNDLRRCWFQVKFRLSFTLTHIRPRLNLYRNQSIDLQFIFIDWFLCDSNIGLIWVTWTAIRGVARSSANV